MVSDDLDRRHVNEFSHAPMLRERRDPLERLPVSRAVPVRLEFCSIERGPLPNEPQRAVGQRTRENVEGFDRDRCVLTRVEGVEVRDAVLRVIHRDGDPVELADPRH